MMEIICLDLEGVLVPEIWIEFAKKTKIDELKKTTRDEPNYDKLMKWRIEILKSHNLKLKDIQDVIDRISPLDGALDFLNKIRELTQVVILSDTFKEFASPLMRQLQWPTILCNSLVIDNDGFIKDIKIRQKDGKRKAVEAFKSIGYKVFASGDSYNDLSMIHTADDGTLFRAPENILKEEANLSICVNYNELLEKIRSFINRVSV